MATLTSDERSPLLGYGEALSATVQADAVNHNGDAISDASSIREPSNARLALIMGSIWIGVALTSIDSTIVATLLVPISSSFSSLKTLSWIGSAYLIGQSISQPLSGRLTDIFGRREGLLCCNIVFSIGTLLCGVATKQWVLTMGRAIAGLGGGAMLTICMCVTGDLVPLRKQGVIQGIANIVMGAGSGLGGLLGGWVNSIWGWRMAFLIQIPFLLVGAVMVNLTVRVSVKESELSALQRMDYVGSLTLSIALILFLLGVNTGGNDLPWSHPLVLTSLPLAGLFLLIFVYVEEKVASEPIIPVRLLLNRTVAAACLSYWFTFMSFYGITFYMPVYLQLLGNSPTEAGVRFIASSAGTAFGALGAGVAMRATGNYWYLNKAHHLLLVLGSGLMVSLQCGTPSWHLFLYLAIFGLGFGGMLVTTLIALVSAVDQDHQAVVTSAGYAFRSTGSAIGLTVVSAVFQNILRVRLQSSIGSIVDADDIINRIRDNFDEVNHLNSAIRESVQESYMQSIRGVFLVTCAFSVLSAFMSMFMRQHVLYSSLARR